MGWLSVVLVADHDGSLGLQRLLGAGAPGACCCWRCGASARRCARRRRSWSSWPRSWSTSSAPASRSTSTASTTSRPTCRPATGWSTSRPTRWGTPRGCAATSPRRPGSPSSGWAPGRRSALRGDRPDVLGAFWFLCLVGFLRWGPSREVYVGAAVVVTWLEVLGTELATWTWQPTDPTGLVSIGNPPDRRRRRLRLVRPGRPAAGPGGAGGLAAAQRSRGGQPAGARAGAGHIGGRSGPCPSGPADGGR